jgi:hypothetical protein
MQKQHIHELHQMYKDNWDIRQDVILRSHNAKVSELQDACQSKGQVDSHSTASVTALQAQVTQLLAQLATLGVQPIVGEQTAPLFVASPGDSVGESVGAPGVPGIAIDDHSAAGDVNAALVPGLSQEEKATRIAIASAAFPPLESKGKGKGSGGEVHY